MLERRMSPEEYLLWQERFLYLPREVQCQIIDMEGPGLRPVEPVRVNPNPEAAPSNGFLTRNIYVGVKWLLREFPEVTAETLDAARATAKIKGKS